MKTSVTLNNFRKIIKDFSNWPAVIANHFGLLREPILKHRSGILLSSRNRLDSKTAQEMLDGITYNKKFIEKALNSNQKGDVIDVGSHIGSFTLWANLIQPGNRYLLLEPDKDNYRVTNENIKLNKISSAKVANVCLADKAKLMTFYSCSGKKHSQSSSLYKREDGLEYKIKTTTLVEIIKTSPSIKLLKMDCEGAEFEIINNLESKYYKNIKAIVFEYHEDLSGGDHKELVKILKKQYSHVISNQFKNKKRGVIYASN